MDSDLLTHCLQHDRAGGSASSEHPVAEHHLPPALLPHLREVAVDLNAGQAIPQILTDLIDDLTSAIPSYAGLRLTVVHTGHPVVLTVFTNLDHTPVTTSLRIPLVLTAPGVFEPGSAAVFWAHTPGAFIDMAADLSYVLQADSASESVTVDGDLPPQPQTSGLTGLTELSTINQAIGVLIVRGYEPDDAKQKLRRDADAAGQPIAQIASHLLNQSD